ncbi:MAG: MCE family protein [Planctomycetes bacterium]|nr:MCE family protein [Planctomycetota bacterium]
MEIVPFLQRMLGAATTLSLAALSVVSGYFLFHKAEGETFVIYFEESVDGLSKGAAVTYNGIEVGYVARIEPVREGKWAGSTAVVIVIASEHLGEGEGKITIYQDPRGEAYRPWVSWFDASLGLLSHYFHPYRPWVSWVDPGVPANDRILDRLDWVYAVNDKPVSTVKELEERVREALDRGGKEGERLYNLWVRRHGSEKLEPMVVKNQDLGVSFSEGGTRATMAQNLVTRIKHVELIGGHPHLETARGISTAEEPKLDALSGAEIRTQETGLARVLRQVEQRLPSILTNVDSLTANLDDLAVDLKNQTDTLHELLENVREITDPDSDIGTALSEAARAFESARKSLEQIEAELSAGGRIRGSLDNLENLLSPDGEIVATLHSVQDLMTTLNDQFEEGSEVHDILLETRASLAATRVTVEDIRKYFQEDGQVQTLLKTTNDTMKNVDESLSGTGRIGGAVDEMRYSVQHDLRPTLRQLNETMRVLQDWLARYNANPEVLKDRPKPGND